MCFSNWPHSLSIERGQNPGVITIVNAVFGWTPPISPEILTKTFQVDKKIINYLKKQFWYDNN
ncbi:hypothetical protein Ahy_A06g027604 [Arachis hypogaea]|uniref:Cupin type-1 domain-containing protein n=1 Tax=Arachis hypogaea TaxID=3818 RepID=A0A445CP61_ARAHY|nr:hypothetical protein Ahy_A06g027604 [Arachis hypogaea]